MISLTVPSSDSEVLDMVQDIWANKAQKRFARIIKDLKNKTPQLERWYFSSATTDNLKPNKLHRIFHPALISRLYSIYSQSSKHNQQEKAILADCIVPLFENWEKLFNALSYYYDDPNTLQPLIHDFQLLIHAAGFLCSEPRETLAFTQSSLRFNPFVKATYTKRYIKFCETLAKLPITPSSTTNTLLRSIRSNTRINSTYPPIRLTAYAQKILPICNRDLGIIQDSNGNQFYISPKLKIAWEIIRQLCLGETLNDGFVKISPPDGDSQWHHHFSNGKKDKHNNLSANDFRKMHIKSKPRCRQGLFRLI